MLFGVDIASWQGSPDFARLRREGHDFAITKVTGEGDYINPYWRRNVDNATAAGLIVGTYDWVEPQGAGLLTGALAARDYLRVLNERQAGHLLCVDFETPDWATGPLGRSIEPWMREYLYTLRELSGQPVIVYTARYFLEETGARHWEWLGRDFPYWQAAPGPLAMLPDDAPWPGTTAPFAETLIHQHQWHATSGAVAGEFDRNRFRGTREALLAYGRAPAGQGHAPATPEGVTASINAEGNAILTINFGGWVKAVKGYVVVDAGVSTEGHDGATYHRTLRAAGFEDWVKQPAE